MMKFQAYRGVSSENPENTMPAFKAAVEQGYDLIELDVKVTKDGQFVVLHDQTINRTARRRDGSELSEEIAISDLTYEQACEYDFGIWFSAKFKNTLIPLLEEVLEFARDKGIFVKLNADVQNMDEGQRTVFFQYLHTYKQICWSDDTEEYTESAEGAFRGTEIIRTTGKLKPVRNQGKLADMHTHSENSHDSQCKIEDMCQAAIAYGIICMAVTDHCDIFRNPGYDIYTPIQKSWKTVMELRDSYKGQCDLLTGIEISEGYLYPDENRKIMDMLSYDVVIGSLHAIEKNGRRSYGTIIASDKEDIHEFMEAYFRDMLQMIERQDFDVLAHLTCPVRFVAAQGGGPVDLQPFAESIRKVLKALIRRGIALEVNTSGYGLMGDFMPDKKILQEYYELGGYLLTLGSDAHTTDKASQYFEEAVALLKEIGFRDIFYYKDRRPYQITL